MNWQNVHRAFKSDYLKLLPIMGLAFYIAFIPHQNYPYPVHLDEWQHLAFFNEIIKEGSVVGLSNPFFGGAPIINNQIGEVSFHLYWVVFYLISGISWLTIFRYFSGIIFMITVLAVYVLARRQGFGWEAAFLTCLIPTMVGILGPAFMVPAAMGLLFVSLSLFIAFNFSNFWSYMVLLTFLSFMFLLHAPTAVVLIVILIPYILLNLKDNFKYSLGLILAVTIPVLIVLPWIWELVLPQLKALLISQSIPPFVSIPRIIESYGYFPVSLCLLGVFSLGIKRRKGGFGLLFGLLALLLVLVIKYTFHYGPGLIYLRGLTFMMLMMGIIGGAGLRLVRNIRLPSKFSIRLKMPFISENMGNALCLVLIGLTLATCIPVRRDIPYYHMIDEEDYKAFVWIKENVDSSYDKAILDPWKSTAFTAITGKTVYTRIGAKPGPSDEKAYEFLRGGCSDTAFLREKGISIVYTQWECRNSDLEKVRNEVYLLKEP